LGSEKFGKGLPAESIGKSSFRFLKLLIISLRTSVSPAVQAFDSNHGGHNGATREAFAFGFTKR
jgi:hypothetical protein